MTLTVCLQYFIQDGFHVMVPNVGVRSHFTFIDCMFYVGRALQQKQQQHQCIIYCMCCRSLLSENSGQISIRDSNTECMQTEFEFQNQSSKIQTSFNIPNIHHSNVNVNIAVTENNSVRHCKRKLLTCFVFI